MKPGFSLIATKDGKTYEIMDLEYASQKEVNELYKRAGQYRATVEELPRDEAIARFQKTHMESKR